MRPMRRAVPFLLLAAALLAAPPVVADDDPKADPKGEPSEEIFLGVDKVDVEAPKMRVERPSDSWQFINLELAQRQAREQGQDTSGYATLKARLYQGRTRSNIFVHAQPDPQARKEPPPAQELAGPMIEGLVRALGQGKLEQQ